MPPDTASPIAGKLAALRTEAGLATILDGIGEGFYAVDCDWRIILFNNEAARHFKCAAADVLGRVLWDAFPRTRETGLGQLFLKVMAGRETIGSEAESVVFRGRWMAYRLFPLGDGIGVVFRDTTDRRSAEAQRDLLMNELEHRVKNTLTTVQAIAAQTFRLGGIDPGVQRDFEARLIALAGVHRVLTQDSWESAEIGDVVRAALRPHGAPERFTVEGPALRLGPQAAVALSMAVHELCTNAIKYGALAAENGRVGVRWSVDEGRLHWEWREHGGAPVSPPARRGFGTRMIEGALARQLSGNATIEFAPDGIVCRIDVPLETIREGA